MRRTTVTLNQQPPKYRKHFSGIYICLFENFREMQIERRWMIADKNSCISSSIYKVRSLCVLLSIIATLERYSYTYLSPAAACLLTPASMHQAQKLQPCTNRIMAPPRTISPSDAVMVAVPRKLIAVRSAYNSGSNGPVAWLQVWLPGVYHEFVAPFRHHHHH